MNALLAIGALLLADPVLPSGENPAGLPMDQFNVPTDQGPAAPRESPRARRPAGPTDRSGGPRYRGSGTMSTRRNDPSTGGEEPYVPSAPTDPDLKGPDSPFAAPTEGSSTKPPVLGTPLGTTQRGGVRAPLGSPLRASKARVAASRQISNMVAQQAQASRLEPARPNPVARPGKPFAGYTPPPGVSPYMNLYRRGAGDSDNYTTLVRPLVEQQHDARIFGGEIRGLQSATRLQTSALQKLGKQTQTQAGTAAPEFFMNYRDYYPAFSR